MGPATEGTWFRAEGTRNGKPVLVRGREDLAATIRRESHGRLLRIVWKYALDDDTGLPSSDLRAKMAAFENAVFDEVEKDGLCVLFSVYTHDGAREWCAYCSDVKKTGERISAALSDHEVYPVEMSVEDDPTWNEYTCLLDGTGLL